MARSRKEGAAGVPPLPTPQPPASRPVVGTQRIRLRLWTTHAGDDGCLALYQDAARGVLIIAPANPERPRRLGKPAREFLRQNDFVPEVTGGAWTRPRNPDADVPDRLYAEWVLLKVGALHRDAGPSRSRGRRGRSSVRRVE